MLTCEICGEDVLLEEDMKTHLLLSHAESDASCPLCSLSGVSYDELCLHISSAHPEDRHRHNPTPSTSSADPPPPRGQSAVTPHRGTSTSVKTPNLEATHSRKSEHKKAKQKRHSSPRKAEFSCPMCALVCSSSLVLQEHVELHLRDEQSGLGAERRLECPMCSVVCNSSFSLQEHVELHLDCGAGSPAADLKLARKLQEEEEELRRREEEAQREREEFKKLQRQFGLDGSGGYRRQMERTMERDVARGLMDPADYHCKRAEMMESLASGVDDGRTRTNGVLPALYEYYHSEYRDSVHVWLSADTDHYCSSSGDKGWGCGYRNFQMLLSSLHRLEAYASRLQERAVPSIPRVQSLIEEAWEAGLDPQGASHFNRRLRGTRAWIGATEIYALLTSQGIKARIVDFHQPTGPGGTHPRLFDWVKQYFSESSCRSGRLPPRLVQTSLPPLYLQHQGHSRTIVGVEQKKNGTLCLLLLDPGSSPADARKLLHKDAVSTAVRQVRKSPGSLKHKQYQVVVVQGVLSAEEKKISISNSRTLCAERIP